MKEWVKLPKIDKLVIWNVAVWVIQYAPARIGRYRNRWALAWTLEDQVCE